MPGSRAISYECPIRDVLDRVGDAWTVLVIFKLKRKPWRFNELNREIEGISPRMLTVTLRRLERDGLVSRTILDTSPPQVEYSLTQRGFSLYDVVIILGHWAEDNQVEIRKSRVAFDLGKKRI